MINNERTKEKYGHHITDLTPKSNRPVVMKCDYCEQEYESSPKRIKIAHKDIATDCCGKCKARKREEVSLLKYGVKNPFQREDIKEKIKDTVREKYGVDFITQSEQMKEKAKQTCLEKYGSENAMNSNEIRTKHKNVCLQKYGVENVSSVPEFKEKRKQTNLDKFGHEYYVASKECKRRVKEKYGVDNVFQLDFVKAKIVESRIASGNIKTYEGMTVGEWAELTGFSREYFNELVNSHGWDFAISQTPSMTRIEALIADLFDKNDIEYETQYRVENKYADFKVGNLIIECNGNYWHSDMVQEDNSYHFKKRELYEKHGFTPLFFCEDEILEKFDIVKSIILNKLGRSERIFARKLEVHKISKKRADEFFSENHLMGRGQGDAYALMDKGRIISAIRMRRRKGDSWDVSRFCHVLNTTTTGGFSRLLSSFIKQNDVSQITTFIDRRYGSGEYLSDLGFKAKMCYKSFNWTNGKERFHRMKFPSNSGYEHNMAKIWDCGQAKYVKLI